MMSFLAKPKNRMTSILSLSGPSGGRKRPPGKRGKAAWSRVEDVLAERQLEKELRDIFEDD